MYSIKDIQALIHRSPQSIYKLMKSNKELKEILKDHIIKEGHNVYYDEVVFEWFKKYYMIKDENKPLTEESVVEKESKSDDLKNPINTPPPYDIKDELIEELRQQISVMNDEIENLKNDISQKEMERQHFITENDTLLKLLAAEKQEKQRLLLVLPPARKEKKPLFEKIRGLITRKNDSVE